MNRNIKRTNMHRMNRYTTNIKARTLLWGSPLLGILLCLEGCGLYNDSFSCPMGEGMRCASVSSVNEAFNKKEDVSSKKEPPREERPLSPFNIAPLPQTVPTSFKNEKGDALRTKEVVLKVYMPPHEVKAAGEEKTILMGDSYGYVVGEPSHWIYSQKETLSQEALPQKVLRQEEAKKFLFEEEEDFSNERSVS